MRIGELAAKAGVPPRTIRFYEQAGILPPPPRTPGGYRDYDETALAKLQFVRSGQALGLSLAEIAEILKIRDDQGAPCEYVAEVLESHVRDLERRITELTTLRNELRERLPSGSRPDPSRCASSAICYLIDDNPAPSAEPE
jgi:DNA-binding transcriptional MerR regulator